MLKNRERPERRATSVEKTRLSAAYLNGCAAVVLTAGGLSLLGSQNAGESLGSEQILFAVSCVGVSALLYVSARALLKRVIDGRTVP